MDHSPLRIGVAGLGTQGVEHIDAILALDDFKLTAVCDASPERLQDCLRGIPSGETVAEFSSVDEMLASGKVEAAVIVLPHDYHPAAVESAARHGIHLLKEKPLGRTLEEGHRLASKMRGAGVALYTGVQRRLHSSYEYLGNYIMKHELRSKVISMRVEILIRATAPSGWRGDPVRSGGGILVDLGYHGVDLAQALVGPMMPLSCTMWNERTPVTPPHAESAVSVWARAGGTWVHLAFARTPDTKREQVQLELPDMVLEANREEVSLTTHDGTRQVLHTSDSGWTETQRRQLQNFAQMIRSGSESVADVDSQLPALRFIDSCYARQRGEGLIAYPEAADGH